MTDPKYGRLFTEADVRRLIAEAGGPPDNADADALLAEFDGTFPPDEPLFLLRGQDALAPDVLLVHGKWIVGTDRVLANHRRAAWAAADGMREWQAQHPDRVKVPD